MNGPQVLSIVVSVGILVVLFEMLRRHRLREKYAVLWFTLAVGALVVAIFPGLLVAATHAVGLELPSNLLFFVSTLVLLGLSLQISFELGRTEERVRTLAEEVALLKVRMNEHGLGGDGGTPRE